MPHSSSSILWNRGFHEATQLTQTRSTESESSTDVPTGVRGNMAREVLPLEASRQVILPLPRHFRPFHHVL